MYVGMDIQFDSSLHVSVCGCMYLGHVLQAVWSELLRSLTESILLLNKHFTEVYLVKWYRITMYKCICICMHMLVMAVSVL